MCVYNVKLNEHTAFRFWGEERKSVCQRVIKCMLAVFVCVVYALLSWLHFNYVYIYPYFIISTPAPCRSMHVFGCVCVCVGVGSI